jgi:hypothetical protein
MMLAHLRMGLPAPLVTKAEQIVLAQETRLVLWSSSRRSGTRSRTSPLNFGSNVTEVVQTFPTYVKEAASNFLGLGASGVVIAEQLPTNVWESGTFSYRSPVFAYYSQYVRLYLESALSYQNRLATLELGGPASNVFFVQHGAYAAQAQRLLGKAIVDANYPMDHAHTAPLLADVVSNPLCVHPKTKVTVV